MTGKNRRKSYGREYDKWKKKGFTTVELIIVIVLVMILAGGLVFGVSYWITKINFDRQNEYARALYAAAQNQLTEYSTSGQMDSLQSALQDKNGNYKSDYLIGNKTDGMKAVTSLIGADGEKYDLEELWPESKNKPNEAKYRDQICSLKGTPDDYAKYLDEKNGTSGSGTSLDSGRRALYAMLDSYLYDTDILSKGVVCVEFTPRDGQVFAVLYSDKAADFTYEPTEDRKGTVSISSREVRYRKARMVGYYGVDTLYKATSTKLERPTIQSLKLNNEDTLNLSFQIGKIIGAEQELQYEISVYDSDSKDKQERLRIKLDGSKLKNKNSAQTIPCEVVRYQYLDTTPETPGGNAGGSGTTPEMPGDNAGGSGTSSGTSGSGSGNSGTKEKQEQPIGKYNILAWLEGTGESMFGTASRPVIRIVLDAADTGATTALYKEAYADLTNSTYTKSETSGSGNTSDVTSPFEQSKVLEFKKTLSFRRFGLTDVENIFCSVKAQGNLYKPAAKKQSNSENTYFGSWRTSKSSGEGVPSKSGGNAFQITDNYTIRNGRHLYNIRYQEDYTAEEYQGYQAESAVPAVLTVDGGNVDGGTVGEDTVDKQNRNTVYLISDSFDWTKFASESLYHNGASDSSGYIRELQDKDQAFPSIRQLGASAQLRSMQNRVVSGLKITAEGNREARLYEDATSDSTGDSVDNQGTPVGATADPNDPSQEASQSAGLFLTNYGAIENVKLDQIRVTGGEKVGTFCGVNKGKLDNLTVLNTMPSDENRLSRIEGIRNVGGIAGTHEFADSKETSVLGADKSVTCENLVNYAEVTERSEETVNGETPSEARIGFGGIFGSLKAAQDTEITLKDAENYGKVYAQDNHSYRSGSLSDPAKLVLADADGAANPSLHTTTSENVGGDTTSETLCLGGIVGYTFAGGTTNEDGSISLTGTIRLETCASSPQYTSAEVNAMLSPSGRTALANLQKSLKGKCVGGIVGFNSGAQLVYCNTQRENSEKDGYVFGKVYVGGIVGYNVDLSGSSAQENNGIDGETQLRTRGRSQVHVIGEYYVGGIVGGNPTGQVTNWVNQGFVGAVKAYAGGITGYNGILPDSDKDKNQKPNTDSENAGIINCSSAVAANRRAVSAFRSKSQLLSADYVGGIAGYNNGTIHSDSSVSIVSNLAGRNYVGGVVGYNDVDAIVKNYKVSGGFIEATGSYVGGFCGLNASKRLIMDENGNAYYVESNPNLVKGYSCVGGIIGGNIIPTDHDATKRYDIQCGFLTDNFLGELVAEGAFAGGYIGYNRLVSDRASRKAIMEYVDASAQKLMEIRDSSGTNETKAMALADTNNIFRSTESAADSTANPTENTEKLASTDAQMKLSGKENVISTQVRFGGIHALIYVGGAMGYNDDTTLLIQNVSNKTPVTAKVAVPDPDKDQTDGSAQPTKTYSYAGGMIGKVTKNVTLDNCRNQDTGKVVSVGTYTGGLCEVNEGTIRNCFASSLGSSDKSYVGGIAGVNRSGAMISNCTLRSGSTITGLDYVGGIVSENYGTIEGVSVKGNVRAYGNVGYVGGITGYNYPGGSIRCEGKTVEITITANGSNVGGIAGMNAGSLSGIDDTGNKKMIVKGKITGADYVGGIVGRNQSDESDASNTNSNSNVNQTNVIERFCNESVVSATAEKAHAGGIVGHTSGTIRLCENKGEVSAYARDARAGGIVAVNLGSIQECKNGGEVKVSDGLCGGITAVNGEAPDGAGSGSVESGESLDNAGSGSAESTAPAAAEITGCEVYGNRLTYVSRQMAGGVCAQNYGTITSTEVSGIELNDLAQSKGSMLGGIAGLNGSSQAIINDCTVNGVTVKSYSTEGSLGGVAGVNRGTITGRAIDSASTENPYTNVNASLSFLQHDMVYFGNLGGIAGKNEGTIKNYSFSGTVKGTANNPQNTPQYDPTTDGETSGAVIYGYGGIAGVNGSSDYTTDTSTGTIQGCEVKQATIIGIGDATNIANIGGVAGVNGKGSTIKSVTVGDGEKNKSYPAENKMHFRPDTVTELDQKDTYSVYVGTLNHDSAYGHTGGIAGLNAGEIAESGARVTQANDNATTGSTDTVESNEDHVPIYTELQSSSVLVENNYGHVGGITGYNRRTGVITKVATGTDWVVFAPSTAPDNGCGGIIGYQAGDRGLQLCANAATVVKLVGGSNGVGGMVGRMEVATARNYLIRDCVNYGKIFGQARVAGMIGVAKYYGFTLSGCKNYGYIYAHSSKDSFAGGMIGNLYSIDKNYGAVAITSCENHGTIKGGTATGGIVGGASSPINTTSTLLQAVDCVNTGMIDALVDKSAGFLGDNSKLDGKSSFIHCRNYGYNMRDLKKMPGIFPNGGTFTIKDCFGIALLDTPLSDREDMENSYYLTSTLSGDSVKFFDTNGKQISTQPDQFYVRQINAPGISTGKHLYKLVAEWKEDPDRAWFSGAVANSDNCSYEFVFNREIDLKSIDLYWNDQNSTREQDYTVYYSRYTSGDNYQEYAKVNNTGKPGCAQSKQTVIHEDGESVTARRVKIQITASKAPDKSDKVNACLIRAHFKGTYEGANGETETYAGYQLDRDYTSLNNLGLSFDKTKSETTKTFTSSTVGYETVELGGTTGKGTPAEVVSNGNNAGYKLLTGSLASPVQVGYAGFPMNPYTELKNAGNDKLKNENLTVLDDEDNNIRYQIFEADDPYFVAKTTQKAPGMPTDLKITGTSGRIKVTWTPPALGASFYEYTAVYMDENNNTIESRTDRVYGTSVELPINEIDGRKISKITVSVRAGAYNVKDPGKILWSKPATADYTIQTILPVPKYHLELVNVNDQFQYQAFLDNKSDYEGLGIELSKIKIKIEVNGAAQFDFSVADAKSSGKYYGGSDGNAMFKAHAYMVGSSGQGVLPSAETLRESQAFISSTYKGEGRLASMQLADEEADDVGFRGDTSETLNYNVKLKNGSGSVAFYMRTELTAVDAKLGVPVSLSSSEVRISQFMSSYISTALTALPDTLTDPACYTDLMVRSYPTLMSNNIVYNGHDVDLSRWSDGSKGVSREQLEKFYVTAENQVTTENTDQKLKKLISDEGGKKKLADGFVIRLNEDGTYSLYYNTLLAYNSIKNYSYKGEPKKTAMMTQVYYYNIPENVFDNKQPQPEIYVNPISENGEYVTIDKEGTTVLKEGDPNSETWVIVWDPEILKTNYENDARYDYTITGVVKTEAGSGEDSTGTGTGDGREEKVLIETGTYTTRNQTDVETAPDGSKSGPNKLILDASSWSYSEIQISISRRGTLDNKGMTEVFPNSGKRTIGLKKRLSQIEGPVVELHKIDGIVQKDALEYDVKWGRIPKDEWKGLGAYEITARSNIEENTTEVYTFNSLEEYRKKLQELQAKYNDLKAIPQDGKNWSNLEVPASGGETNPTALPNGTIVLKWTGEGSENTDLNTSVITVTSSSEDGTDGGTSSESEQKIQITMTQDTTRRKGDVLEKTKNNVQDEDRIIKEISLYDEKAGVTEGIGIRTESRNEDGTGTITWKWTEQGSSGEEISKTLIMTLDKMQVSSEDGAAGETAPQEKWRISKALTTTWRFPAAEEQVAVTSGSTLGAEAMRTIDLSDYDYGDTVQISVRAIANANAVYRDGPEGVITDMTIPFRLDVPDLTVNKFESLIPYSQVGFITIAEIEETGLQVKYDVTEEIADVNGSYELAVAVYDEKPQVDSAHPDVSQIAAGDMPDEGASDGLTYWNSGAHATIYHKSSPLIMDGNLKSASAVIQKLSKTYGGKWMKIAIRSTSDSSISSWWSDEDEAAENTINYQWIQIPRVQEETPEAESGSTDMSYVASEEDTGTFIYTEVEDPTSISANQKTVSFTTTDLADHYQIERIRRQRSTDDLESAGVTTDYTIKDVDWLYLEKVSDESEVNAYHVFYATTDPNYNPDARREELDKWSKQTAGNGSEIPQSTLNKNAMYIGTLTPDSGNNNGAIPGISLPEMPGSSLTLPYTGTIPFMHENEPASLQSVSVLQMEMEEDDNEENTSKGAKFTLVLPDTESIQNTSIPNNEGGLTAQISVIGIVDQKNVARFADSRICHLYDEDGEWKSKEIMERKEAPEGITITNDPIPLTESDTSSGYPDYKLSVESATEWLAFEVTLTNAGSGGTADPNTQDKIVRYVSCWGTGATTVNNIAILPISSWMEQAGWQLPQGDSADDADSGITLTMDIRVISIGRIMLADPMSGGLSKWSGGLTNSFTITLTGGNAGESEELKEPTTSDETQGAKSEDTTEAASGESAETKSDPTVEPTPDDPTGKGSEEVVNPTSGEGTGTEPETEDTTAPASDETP